MENTAKKVDIWYIIMYLILYSIAGFIIVSPPHFTQKNN